MDENIKAFEESFKEFISQRLNEDLGVLILENKELKEMYEDSENYHKKIFTAFDKGDKEAFEDGFDKFTSIQDEICGNIAELSYLQGMKDTYRLIKMLEKRE